MWRRTRGPESRPGPGRWPAVDARRPALSGRAGSSGGEGVFALRNDLNAISGASQPFVLLKYRDPATDEWRFKLYSVVLEDSTHRFVYEAEAGQELLPPYPVSLLPLCSE